MRYWNPVQKLTYDGHVTIVDAHGFTTQAFLGLRSVLAFLI